MTTKSTKVLIIDDDPVLRNLLEELLKANNYTVDTAANGKEGFEKFQVHHYDHVLTDISMPEMNGLELLKKIQQTGSTVPVTVISAHSEMDNVVKAVKLGASDFIAKPFQSDDEILITLRKVEERARLQEENDRLRKELAQQYTFSNIVAKSKKMQTIFEMITKIADYKTTVLITGDSGTGKELVAKAIHFNSCRKQGPLISVNCGSIPDTLLESELFGHARGAFTDAVRDKKGLFEEAHGGTLFLDEIGELPMPLQVKLLRALQEEEIRPLGTNRDIKVDVRIIAATARNLRQEVAGNRFREDLYYRINVLAVDMPPLRERKEDIPLLIGHFIKKYNSRLGLAVASVDHGYLQRALEYDWPGNVRELENIIERSMALTEGSILSVKGLPQEMTPVSVSPENLFHHSGFSIKQNTKNLEKQLISKALTETRGNKSKAAIMLELSLPALHYKLKEYGLTHV